MAITAGRGHAALRLGRWSAPGCEYFLTICTYDRCRGLEAPAISAAIRAASDQLESEGAWQLRTATIMPDHLHLLMVLGHESTLPGIIRLFKGRMAPVLRAAGLRWERGYFDHRVRTEEDRLPYFLYIFLNPYRAKLIPIDQRWPAYFCAREDWSWFGPLTDADCPLPEWLK